MKEDKVEEIKVNNDGYNVGLMTENIKYQLEKSATAFSVGDML